MAFALAGRVVDSEDAVACLQASLISGGVQIHAANVLPARGGWVRHALSGAAAQAKAVLDLGVVWAVDGDEEGLCLLQQSGCAVSAVVLA